jgi:hypothetical protein
MKESAKEKQIKINWQYLSQKLFTLSINSLRVFTNSFGIFFDGQIYSIYRLLA